MKKALKNVPTPKLISMKAEYAQKINEIDEILRVRDPFGLNDPFRERKRDDNGCPIANKSKNKRDDMGLPLKRNI